MIDIPKSLLNKVKMGAPVTLLEDHIANTYPMPAIIKAFAELILLADDAVNKPQINVTQEEYDTIMSLFKIRGIRVGVNGEVVRENRGRPRKIQSEDAGENSFKLDL